MFFPHTALSFGAKPVAQVNTTDTISVCDWWQTAKAVAVFRHWLADCFDHDQGAGLQDKEWFAGVCDRKTAEETVLRINKVCLFKYKYLHFI